MNRPDLAARIVADYLAANPMGQRTDIVVTVTDHVTETVRTVMRPMTVDELAAWEIARRIDEAAGNLGK
jgi:hypothetical protein